MFCANHVSLISKLEVYINLYVRNESSGTWFLKYDFLIPTKVDFGLDCTRTAMQFSINIAVLRSRLHLHTEEALYKSMNNLEWLQVCDEEIDLNVTASPIVILICKKIQFQNYG